MRSSFGWGAAAALVAAAAAVESVHAWSPINVTCDPSQPAQWCAEKQNALDFHNYARYEVGVPLAVWWDYLESQARDYAIQLAQNDCNLVHSPSSSRPNQGENLAAMWGGGMPLGAASSMYYNEKSLWQSDWVIGDGNFESYGHYTQMIWRTSQRVGCSRSGLVKTSSGGTCEVSVCRYYPSGNVVGQNPVNAS